MYGIRGRSLEGQLRYSRVRKMIPCKSITAVNLNISGNYCRGRAKRPETGYEC